MSGLVSARHRPSWPEVKLPLGCAEVKTRSSLRLRPGFLGVEAAKVNMSSSCTGAGDEKSKGLNMSSLQQRNQPTRTEADCRYCSFI